MAAHDWDPDQYHRFRDERSKPFWDLAALVDPKGVDRFVDLGCGTGELTAALAQRLDANDVVGVDNSPAMLERSVGHEAPGLRFVHGDIAEWVAPATYDLVFANASLHWVPDHGGVLARWTSSLRTGGQLAVQVPANADHPSHLASAEVAHTEPFLSALGGEPPPDPVAANVVAPEAYAGLLHDLGFAEQHVRLQVYGQVMTSSNDVVEWVKGTSLTRFFAALPDALHEPFVDAYRRRLLETVGDRSPYYYPFKRILMWGRLGKG